MSGDLWRSTYPWLSRHWEQTYGVKVIEPATDEPLTLAEAWAHLRLDTYGSPPASDDDYWLENIGIPAARDWCEQYIGGTIAPRVLELAGHSFPRHSLQLHLGPVLSVDEVTYTDSEGDPQTMDAADYELDQYVNPNRLRLASGASWPTSQGTSNSVKVRYTAGYSFPTDSPGTNPLPKGIKIALLLMLGHLFTNRENTIGGPSVSLQLIPEGAASFLEDYRLRLSMA